MRDDTGRPTQQLYTRAGFILLHDYPGGEDRWLDSRSILNIIPRSSAPWLEMRSELTWAGSDVPLVVIEQPEAILQAIDSCEWAAQRTRAKALRHIGPG